jgi:O-antigen ligase
MEVSLRRGATHSLVTDLLLVFGVVGFVTYMTMYVCLLMLLWRLWKNPTSDEIAKPIALAAFLLGGFNLTYGILGGATFPLPLAWLLVCLFAYLYRVEAWRSADQKHQPLKPVPHLSPSFVRGDSLRGRPHLAGVRGFSERRSR